MALSSLPLDTLLVPLVLRFCLVLARLVGLFVSSPLLGNRMFPSQVRVASAIILGVIFTVAPGVAVPGEVPMHAGYLFLLCVREFAIGALLGMFVRLLVGAMMMAGSMVGIQMGLAAAMAMDPQGNGQVTLIGQVLGLLAISILFAFDAHHMMVAALYHSFQVAPIGEFSLGSVSLGEVQSAGADLFRIAVAVAAPVIVAVFVTNVGMALVARTIPQMNVFVVGFLLTISLAYLTLSLSTHGIAGAIEELQADMGRKLVTVVGGL